MATTANPTGLEKTGKDAAVHSEGRQDSSARRLRQACVFWLLCLTLSAAGHRLYKFVVSTDRAISAEFYQTTEGAALVWVGYGELEDSANRIMEKSSLPAATVAVNVLPNSSFWVGSAILFTAIGIFLVWSGRWIQDNGTQSLIGLFAGHCFWIGSIEFGLDATGRSLGLAGSLDIVGDKLVGTHSAGTLIQASIVFLIPVFVGLSFHESNRCVVFNWFRQRLPILRNPNASGRVENYAARTAMQFFMTVWFCYVAVLWLADPIAGSFGHWSLLLILIAVVLTTPYMVWRTVQQPNRGKALRYSVSGAIITWSAIEIASSMQMFEEPWLSTSRSSLIFFLLLSLVLTVLATRELTGTKGTRQPHVGVAVLFVVLFLVPIAGCSSNADPTPMTPDEVLTALQDFNGRIRAPQASAIEASKKALYSDDSLIRAQAAIAFGKSMELESEVVTHLQKMASGEEDRISQIAAIVALQKHDALDESSLAALERLRSDENWSSVFQELSR